MRKGIIILLLFALFSWNAVATDQSAEDLFGTNQVQQALPEEAADLMEGRSVTDTDDFSGSLQGILSGAMEQSGGALKSGMALCLQIFAVVMLSSLLRGSGGKGAEQPMVLAGTMAIGAICVSSVSGFFATAAQTIDSMTAFSGFLFAGLASVTAATGAVGTSTTLYGITVLVCGVMAKVVELLFLPGISCYMALMIANSAVGDDSLKLAGDTLKQLLSNGLKLAVLVFTAYLSLSGVISGSADSAAVKAAKLTISTAVPVVGSMIADASETLLVSAGLLKSGLGIFGLLGVLAVSVVPFLQTGCQYLLLKGTAAAAGVVGEKELSGLIGAMAGAMGLLTAVTGACTLILMIGCVCFMKVSI